MLCEDCLEHFRHDGDRSMGYLRLKVALLSSARADLEDTSHLEQLKLNLKQYEQAIRSFRDAESNAPCPWFRGDLSEIAWSPPESFKEDCFMAIWKTPRMGTMSRLRAHRVARSVNDSAPSYHTCQVSAIY